MKWSAMQRLFMEALGYTDLADRLAELDAAGRTEDAIGAVPGEYPALDHMNGPRQPELLEPRSGHLLVRPGP